MLQMIDIQPERRHRQQECRSELCSGEPSSTGPASRGGASPAGEGAMKQPNTGNFSPEICFTLNNNKR